MARQKAFYLSTIDETGVTVARWQQGYPNQTVTWQGEQWEYLPMEVEGVSSGDPANLRATITVPRIKSIWETLELAIANSWQLLLQQYEFDAFAGQDAPQPEQRLVHVHRGVLERLRSPSLMEAKIEIGSPVAKNNTQLLPITLTTDRIGTGVF